MAYRIIYHTDCLGKDLPKLDKSVLSRIKNTIESRLSTEPEVFGKPLRHSKSGLWSLRVGDWRVIYKILQDEIWIVRIGHRSEVYKLF